MAMLLFVASFAFFMVHFKLLSARTCPWGIAFARARRNIPLVYDHHWPDFAPQDVDCAGLACTFVVLIGLNKIRLPSANGPSTQG